MRPAGGSVRASHQNVLRLAQGGFAPGRGPPPAVPGLVWGLAVTEIASWGVLWYALPVVLSPMVEDLGWSRGALVGGFSLAVVVSAVAGVAVGRWLDRHPPRVLMTTASLLAGVLVVAWSQVGSPAAYYTVWAGLGLAMSAVLYEPAMIVLAQHTGDGLRRAAVTVTLVAGASSFVFQPLTAWLAAEQGWRRALVLLGVGLAAVTVPVHAAVLPRRRSQAALPEGECDSVVSPVPVVRGERAVARFTMAFAAAGCATSIAAVHLIPYLIEHGWSFQRAAFAGGVLGVMQLPARMAFGPLNDRLSSQRLTGGVLALPAIAAALLLVLETKAAWASIVLLGLSNGAATLLRTLSLAQLAAPTSYGRVAGATSAFVTLAKAVGPLAAAIAIDATGSYTSVLLAIVCLSAVSTACGRTLRLRRGEDRQ